jgi:uncharacterized protein
MEVLAGFLIIFAFLTTLSPLRDVPESELNVFQHLSPSLSQSQRYDVRPFVQMKDEFIVKQEFDYSCGSAALATLLNSYLGEKLSEQQVIQGMMEYGDSKLIEERRAFSLLDMKQFVTVLGYQGAGYTAELDDLKTLDKPCIVPIEFFGYKHFVVFRGMYNDHMFFADPYMGNLSFSVSEFQKMWHKNIIFLVTSGEVTFNALRLREEDLRLVSFGSSDEFYPQPGRSELVENEQRLKESIGRTDAARSKLYQYIKTNIR